MTTLLPPPEQLLADPRSGTDVLVAADYVRPPSASPDQRLRLDDVAVILNQAHIAFSRKQLHWSWQRLTQPRAGTLVLVHFPGLELKSRLPPDSYGWRTERTRTFSLCDGRSRTQIGLVVNVGDPSTNTFVTRRSYWLQGLPASSHLVLVHYLPMEHGEERLTNDVAAREQLVAPGATNGWFIIGTSAPPPPPGSLPGRHAGATQWRPPCGMYGQVPPKGIKGAPPAMSPSGGRAGPAAAYPGAAGRAQGMPGTAATLEPGGEYYTELETAAARFKQNHELMEELLLPSPDDGFHMRTRYARATISSEDANKAINRLRERQAAIDAEIAQLQEKHAARLAKHEQHSNEIMQSLASLADAQDRQAVDAAQRTLEQQLNVQFVEYDNRVRAVPIGEWSHVAGP